MELTTNMEIQTAEQNIARLGQKVTGPDGQVEKLPSANQATALIALGNEHEILRLAKRIAATLEMLARDYTAMGELFSTQGVGMVYNVTNELPQQVAQLKCRIEARNLYADLLK